MEVALIRLEVVKLMFAQETAEVEKHGHVATVVSDEYETKRLALWRKRVDGIMRIVLGDTHG